MPKQNLSLAHCNHSVSFIALAFCAAAVVFTGCKKSSPGGDAAVSSDGKRDTASSDGLGDTKSTVVCTPDAGDHRKGKAESCSCDAECKSGFCADGVCCTSACKEGCKACNLSASLGDCSFLPAGVQPRHPPYCDATRQSSCGLNGKCDGQGECQKYVKGEECEAGKCDSVSGSITGRSECDGQGACKPAAATNCYPYSCDATTNHCAGACTNDTQCASGQKCQDHSCGKKLNGVPCPTGDKECASGHCADGVCCNSACTGECVDCNLTGSKGQCSFIDKGIGDPACDGQDKSTCANTGDCNGFGSCTVYPENTPCGNSLCTNDTSLSTARTCDGLGTCRQAGMTDCAPFLCTNGACNPDCSKNGDADCENGIKCTPTLVGGIMKKLCGKKKDGQSCTSADECDSAQCVDGFCCENDCSGACRSCGVPALEGKCTHIPAGSADPRSLCADQGKALCQTNGLCDGSGACQKYPTGTTCAPETCKSGSYTPPSSCNSAGQCVAPPSRGCDPYVCNGSACYESCTDNGQCNTQQDRTCVRSSCGLKPPGATCSEASECRSNFCAQGVCCNSACTGACMTCNQSASAGTCTAVADGTPDPQGVCAATQQATCGTTGLCKSGACAAWDSGKNCGKAVCTADGLSSTAASTCDGKSKCVTPAASNCAPFKCDTTTGSSTFGLCKTACASDNDCQSPRTCSSKSCGLKQIGAACTAASQCDSNFCTEGVCCNSACSDATTGTKGLCMSCKVAGKVGTCSSVAAGTDDPKKRCSANKSNAGAGDCSNDGTCDGAGNCAPWSSSTGCRQATCTAGNFTSAVNCDGKGNCPAASTNKCDPYICSTTSPSCLTSCTADNQCVNSVCLPNNKCNAPLADGQGPCAQSSDCLHGHCVDSVCCATACSGGCQSCTLTGNIGTCKAIPAGTAPRISDTCSAATPSTCGTDGKCNGTMSDTNTNVCEYFSSSTTCTASTCPTDTHFMFSACNGSGTCASTQVACQAGYLCSGGVCATSCTTDAQCDTSGGYACDTVQKLCKKKNGQTCTAGTNCVSGNCVSTGSGSSVCCSASCGTDTACGAKNLCDPSGTGCQSHKDEACGTASCSTDGLTSTAVGKCDGAGKCTQVTTPCSPYLCSSTTKACLGSCSTSADCDQGAGFACNTGTQKCEKAGQGAPCTATSQCGSNLTCIENVCCTSAVACGTCKSCAVSGQEGTCKPTPPNSPDASCTVNPLKPCGNTGKCDGAGSCQKPAPGSACGATMSCTGGIQTGGGTCNSSEECVVPADKPCSPYVCSTSACATTCGTDVDCASGFTCKSGECLASKGQACTADGKCASGSCGTNNICCAAPCTDNGECGDTGDCTSGTGTCVKRGPTTTCGSATCSGNYSVIAAKSGQCDGSGTCTPGTPRACPDGQICSGGACSGACTESGIACPNGYTCSGGTCTIQKTANGGACTLGTACDSGNCLPEAGGTGSICCLLACSASPPCGYTGSCASGGLSCEQTVSGTRCAASSCNDATNEFRPAETCNGSGQCSVTTAVACNLFKCKTSGCATSCSDSTDCAATAVCDTGNCVVPTSPP